MKKRVALLLYLVLIPLFSIYAQKVEDRKKTGILPTTTPEKLFHAEKSYFRLPNKSFLPGFLPQKFSPFSHSFKNTPVWSNFNRSQQTRIYKQFSFIGTSEKVTYIGMVQHVSLQGSLRWQPSQKLFIDAGGLFSRQFYYSANLSRQDVTGLRANARYALTPRLRLNTWGQHIFQPIPLSNPAASTLLPHTGVGASVSFDLKRNTDMSIGAEYRYDNLLQKWKVESAGRVSIGF